MRLLSRTSSRCLFILCLAAAQAGSAEEGLQYPVSIAASDAGIYLADRNLPGVWKLDGAEATQFFTGSKKFRTPLNAIRCVEFDHEGKLLAGDSSTREVYRFDEDGKPVPLTTGAIGIPMDIAVNKAGDIYVSNLEIQRVVKVPKEGGEPKEVSQISGCRGLFVDHEDHLWVVSTTKNQLYRIAPDGKQEVIVKDRPFEFPHTVVVDQALTAYVCDGFAKTIWKIAKGGEPEPWVQGKPLVNPVGMAMRGDKILIVDPRAAGVFEIDPEGKVSPILVQPGEG